MLQEEAICHKINQCLDIVDNAIKTKQLDIGEITTLLHLIRKDAQNMENGLRWRKEVMTRVNIETAYQDTRKEKESLPGVNRIAGTSEVKIEKDIDSIPEYEVTITKDGEMVYKNPIHAGVIAMVERFDDIDRYGVITAQSQQLFFGHPLLVVYASDQIQIGMEDKKPEITSVFKQVMEKKKDVDPKIKEVLRKMTYTNYIDKKFKLVHDKKTDSWRVKIKSAFFSFTKEEMKELACSIDIELLEADPDWHKYLESQSKN